MLAIFLLLTHQNVPLPFKGQTHKPDQPQGQTPHVLSGHKAGQKLDMCELCKSIIIMKVQYFRFLSIY